MIAPGIAAAVVLLATVVFEDSSVRFEMPEGWTAAGEDGEYAMESGQDVASLLLLPPDPDRPIEVILAEIEEQFLSTGAIRSEGSEVRQMEGGETVRVRHYRLLLAGESAGSMLMHQYSFVRSAVHVLLQVETPPSGSKPEKLFETIHRSLEVRRAPDPFENEEAEPSDEDGEDDPSVLRVRLRDAAVARALPRVRRVGHARRDHTRDRARTGRDRRPGAHRRGRRARRGARVHRDRRARPRPPRRPGRGFGHATRR